MGPLSKFQIRDLEEFSGVKAHTIRIWEKRYGILAPDRTDTNIRTYGIEDLKTILNVAFLNKKGIKISKIAKLPPADRDKLVRETAVADKTGDDVVDTLKLAMLGFDEVLFESASSKYREKFGFDHLVEKVYIPLLELVGVLWQTNSICPAHEHFVSNIIRHKLVAAGEAVPLRSTMQPRSFVLFLPANEMHELSLLYMNYFLRAKGERTIYLGQSVPHEDLRYLTGTAMRQHIFISVLTNSPSVPDVTALVNDLSGSLPAPHNSLWIAAQGATDTKITIPEGTRLFGSGLEVLGAIRAIDEAVS